MIEGITRMLTALGRDAQVVLEPVHQWKAMLEWFYEDPETRAYAFQTYVYVTRIEAILAAVRAHPDTGMFILERSPESDRMFMETLSGETDPVLRSAYKVWCRTHDRLLPFSLDKAVHVYLATSLGCCMERVAARARPGEAGVSHGYQQRLLRAHDARFRGMHADEFPGLAAAYDPAAVVVVDGDLSDHDFREGVPGADALLGQILAKIDAKLGAETP